ncbi:MAG TPA: glycosyltransferase [Chloroflexota bacterium]|jgi:glycosyltransferase involved in cell wall biosynthesis
MSGQAPQGSSLLSRLSVVVPTRDEAANLPRLLASLPDAVELVLSDASADGTGHLARRLRPARTQVVPGPGTIGGARQRGADAARGDLLLFTDADVAFAPDYFDRLLAHLDADAVYGSKLSRDAYAGYYALVARSQQVVHQVLGVAGASGSNLLVRRSALQAVGGFRPELPCSEDSELVFRLARRGYRVRFAPDLVVYATDHRRLRRGVVAKSLHSLGRNLLLYCVCNRPRLPRLLARDWGYWAHRDAGGAEKGVR